MPSATLSEKQSLIKIKQKGTERAVTESVATDHEATASTAGAMAAKVKIDEADTMQGSKAKEDKGEGRGRFRNERSEGYFGGGAGGKCHEEAGEEAETRLLLKPRFGKRYGIKT